MDPAAADDDFRTPDWVKHAVFYQIFPDRFANGDQSNDPENVRPWGSPPGFSGFSGGDLRGIINRLGYLADLGVNAIYLNPIFLASSNHRYNTFDYYRIDPLLGDERVFQELLDRAHRQGMRVILDGVFNHCGRGFFAFVDVLESGDESPYRGWFHIDQLPLQPYDGDREAGYASWWGVRSLPKLNAGNPAVRRYLLDVARHWIARGADGWRLDVPNEIADHGFWREFRRVVKAANPEAYLVGEIWQDGSAWLDGSQFDGVMNYPWRDLCRDLFAQGSLSPSSFARQLDELQGRYPREASLALLNLLGSHDTPRIRSEAGGDAERIFPAALFQMCYPGPPCIYYGDEIGMAGGADPENRGCVPWDPREWHASLHQWVRLCISLRRGHPALRTGAYRSLLAQDRPPAYAFARWDEQELLVIALNLSDEPLRLDIPLAGLPAPRELDDLIGGARHPVVGERLRGVALPPRRGAVLWGQR